MDDGVLEIDFLWRKIKPWGKFQRFQVFFVLLDFIPACFAIFSAVFTGYIPEYSCDVPHTNTNGTSEHESYTYGASQCHYEVFVGDGNSSVFIEKDCNHFTYSNTLTYASEWDLVCSRANLAALAQSLVLAGQGLGALTMSHLADRFGRKTVHVISHIGVMASMILMAFSTNIIMLLTLRLITGIFQQGIVCTGRILLLELFPRESRSYTEAASSVAWSVGVMIMALFGYVFRGIDWRYLQLALAACSLYALFEWWMLEESVRWLLTNRRVEDAKKILKKATKWNKVDYKEIEDLPQLNPTQSKSAENEKDWIGNIDDEFDDGEKVKNNKRVAKYNVLDILRNPALRANTIILWYAWIVAAGSYYGLTLVSTHLAGDRFLNFFLSGVIEVPAELMEFYLFNKIGRKRTLILWFATAGVSLIISTALRTVFKDNAGDTVATVFSFIGKLASTGCFSTVFLYTQEIYPTNYRNSGLGIASSISRVGGILAPFASNLALIRLWIPGAMFGVMCLLVAVLAIRLPESATYELPSTIADCDKWEQNIKPSDSFDHEHEPPANESEKGYCNSRT